MDEINRASVSTGWDAIDNVMDGGLAGGELGIVVAPAGIGKSWFLNIPEHRYNLAPWRLSRSAISIFPLAIAI